MLYSYTYLVYIMFKSNKKKVLLETNYIREMLNYIVVRL